MRSAIFGAMLVAASLATAQLASAQVFDFETQFSTTSNPTATGWSYRYQANAPTLLRDGNYELLTDYHPNSFGGAGFDAWHPPGSGASGLPGVGKNNGGGTFLGIPPGGGWMHPNPSQLSVLSWTAPADGTANVSFLFNKSDPGGNGIKYFVERGNGEFTLAQATLAPNGASGPVTLPGALRVAAGERINFIVDPNGGHASDSTRVSASVNFAASTASFTDYRAAADLIAFEGTNSGPQAAAGINGVWSYGTSPTNGGAFTAYTAAEHTDSWNGNAAFQGWADTGPNLVPLATVNTTASPNSPCCGITGIDPDQMFLHPGPGNADAVDTRDFSVVRWTAPEDGTIDLSAVWVQKHGNQAEIDALLNGVSLFTPGPQVATTGDGTLLSLNEIAVLAGDTIDFVVGPNPFTNSFGAATTGFDANIRFTAAAVPEPATIALWSLAGLVGVAVALRKRRAKARG